MPLQIIRYIYYFIYINSRWGIRDFYFYGYHECTESGAHHVIDNKCCYI